MKFRIGDKVRITNTYRNTYNMVGVITIIKGNNDYEVETPTHVIMHLDSYELELVGDNNLMDWLDTLLVVKEY